jgi:hypothetical protein
MNDSNTCLQNILNPPNNTQTNSNIFSSYGNISNNNFTTLLNNNSLNNLATTESLQSQTTQHDIDSANTIGVSNNPLSQPPIDTFLTGITTYLANINTRDNTQINSQMNDSNTCLQNIINPPNNPQTNSTNS